MGGHHPVGAWLKPAQVLTTTATTTTVTKAGSPYAFRNRQLQQRAGASW